MATTTLNRTTDSTSNAPTPYTGFDRLFIAGCWDTGRSEHKLQSIDPYRQDVIMEIPAAENPISKMLSRSPARSSDTLFMPAMAMLTIFVMGDYANFF